MPKKPLATEQRVVLPNISWQKFEDILQELGPERQARLSYCRGQLELMTPIAEHDRCHKLIESLIMVMADELQLDVTELAPVLLTHPELGYATEPDACYYFRDEDRVRSQTELDLTHAPCPDLVVEVALSKSQLDKLPIYMGLGIPEVWRYITTAGDAVLKGKLLIYQLRDDRYMESRTSRLIPFLDGDRILQFLEQSDSMSLSAALRLLRAWVQERI